MPGAQREANFHFVDWSDVTGPNKDPATRVLIRKQAMSKAAAARKKRGNWGKRNLGQSVVVLPAAASTAAVISIRSPNILTESKLIAPPDSTDNYSESDRSSMPVIKNLQLVDTVTCVEPALTHTMSISPNMTTTGYEKFRMLCNFDLLDLSALTTFHVGRITTEGLYMSPSCLIDVLQCRQWSYFSYVPSRYGHFACLDDAALCVASRVGQWMKGDVSPDTVVLSLYAKALDSLQVAINDPVLCTKPEVLCATEILSIYELLDNTKSSGWAKHAAGAKSLVKLRGPENFDTSFEKALFMAQIGPIFTESLIENHDCFLHEASWQFVLQSIVQGHSSTAFPFSDRGVVVVSLWTDLCFLPSIYKDVQAAICGGNFISDSGLTRLQIRVADMIMKLSKWCTKYEPLLLIPCPAASSDDAKAEKRFETLGMCLTCLIILKRLAVALDPTGPSASEAESEATALAYHIIDLERQAVVANPRAGLFMRFKLAAAKATLATRDEWHFLSLGDTRVGVNGLIAPWVYQHWCRLKGRKV